MSGWTVHSGSSTPRRKLASIRRLYFIPYGGRSARWSSKRYSRSIMSSSKRADYSLKAKWGPVIGTQSYTQIPNLLIKHRADLGITPVEWSILTSLLATKWTRANPYPSVASLGRQTGRATISARRQLRSLSKKGLIRRIYRHNKSSEYDLTPLINRLESYAQPTQNQTVSQSKVNGPDYSEMNTNKEAVKETSNSKRATDCGKLESVKTILSTS